jgi:hypothetical protein
VKPQQDRSVIEAQATLRKALERQWRAWTALIAEMEAEVQAAARSGDAEEELFEAPPVPKANLPLATRKQLLAAFDARLQTAQAEAEEAARATGQPLSDVEEVRRQLITHIGRELRGEIHEKGLALIYWQGKLVPFDHRALQRSTTASDYLAAGLGKRGGSPLQTALIIGGGVSAILVVMGFLVSMVFAPAAPPPQAGGLREGRVGDQTVTRWDVQAASVGALTLQVAADRVSYPLVVCAPERQAAMLDGTATITGSASLRRYTLGDSGADLRVVACERPSHVLARGTLAESFTVVPAPQGRVRDLWVRGADRDPQRIPADRMEVTLLVDPDIGESSLVLADGTALSPSERRPTDAGLELSYLAPLASAPQAAGLVEQVVGGLPQVTPVMLPAPEARLSYLHRVLAVTDARVERDGTAIRLTLTLRATADRGEPLPILPGDVRVIAGSQTLAATWEPLMVAGDGTPQRLVITIPAASTPMTIAVGTWQASLTP